MVEFDLPDVFTEEFMALIPRQRYMVNQLMMEGAILSYSLSEDRSTLWAVMSAESEMELLDTIERLPLADYMSHQVKELMFHNAASAVMQFSLN